MKLKLKQTLIVAGFIGWLSAGQVARADETAEIIKSLREQIDALDQKVRVLERKRELDQDSSKEAAKAAPVVTIGNSGLIASSGDSNFA